MSEEQDKSKASEQTKTDEGKSSSEASEKIELDAETYGALLDKLEELEGELKGKGKTGDPVKDLAAEARGEGGEKKEDKVDLDSLSQAQLADYIMKGVGQRVVEPLLVQVQAVQLELEIDRLTRDEQYADIFNEHQDRVFELAGENPKLSLKQACDLALKEAGGEKKGSDKSDTTKDRDALLKHLPKRGQPQGEKPGRTGADEKKEPEDRRSAAELAIEDLDIKFAT